MNFPYNYPEDAPSFSSGSSGQATPGGGLGSRVNMLSFQPVPPDPLSQGHPSASSPACGPGPSSSSSSSSMIMHGIDLASTVSLADTLTSSPSSAPQAARQKGKKGYRKKKTAPSSQPLNISTSSSTSSASSSSQKSRLQQVDMKAYVSRLLSRKSGGFADADFAERALLNLSRRLSQSDGLLEAWEAAVSGGVPGVPGHPSCVCIARPKDGRMTVARAGGSTSSSSSTKKVFPQIVVCQIFRWPHIVFHSDIRSTSGCANPAAVKPTPAEEAATAVSPICINPYHYEISPEAQARFSKASMKLLLGAEKPGPVAALPQQPQPQQLGWKRKNAGKGKRKAGGPAGGGPNRSVDEGFGDGEIHDFDSQGVDYLKMWEEKASGESNGVVEQFDNQEVLREIKFLTLDTREPCPDSILEKIGVKELELLLSGELVKPEAPKVFKKEEEGLLPAPKIEESVQSSDSEVEILPPPPPPPLQRTSQPTQPAPSPKTSSSTAALEASLGASRESSEEASSVEDSAIQDLLDDIRGSFERQFDDDFEELTVATAAASDGGAKGAVVAAAPDAAAGAADVDDDFGELEPSLGMLDDFSPGNAAEAAADVSAEPAAVSFQPPPLPPQQMMQQQQQQDFAMSHPHGPSMAVATAHPQQLDDGVPCIVDSWSVPQPPDEPDFLATAPAPGHAPSVEQQQQQGEFGNYFATDGQQQFQQQQQQQHDQRYGMDMHMGQQQGQMPQQQEQMPQQQQQQQYLQEQYFSGQNYLQ